MSSEEQAESGFFTPKRIIIISALLSLVIVFLLILHTWFGYWLLSVYYNYPSCEGICETIHEYTPLWLTGNGMLLYARSQYPDTGYNKEDNYEWFSSSQSNFDWLGKKGDSSVPYIIEGLKEENIYIRSLMLEQVYHLSVHHYEWGTLPDTGLFVDLKRAVVKLSEDRHPAIRGEVLNCLGFFGREEEEFIPVYEHLSNDKNEYVAQNAQTILEEIAGKNVIPEKSESPEQPEEPEMTPEQKKIDMEKRKAMKRDLENF